MAEKLLERKDMDPAYMWNLTKIYKDDNGFEEEFKTLKKDADKIGSFKGTLKDADGVRSFLDWQTDFNNRLSRMVIYSELRKSEDTRADEAKSISMRAENFMYSVFTQLSFAEPELLSHSEEELRNIIDDTKVAEYKTILERIFDKKKHTLSEAEERIAAAYGEVLESPGNIFRNLDDADMTFESVQDEKGEEHELNGANFTTLEASTDRVLRKNAYEKYYAGYKNHINTFAATMSANVTRDVVTSDLRKFDSARQMSMAEERVPEQVYDNLIDAVRRHMPDMHRYVRLRKKLLGVDKLHFYDVYAPLLHEEPKMYTFEEAKELLYKTVSVYGGDYLDTVKKGVGDGWIDAFPNKGKEGGAYSSGSFLTDPYIMMNFTGTLDSVSTLVHEMGHSMHTHYSCTTQPAQYSDYTLFVAEVASTCNENLLIENLLADEKDPKARLELLNQYLENFKGTVYRQTMFAEFEKKAHEASKNGEALTPQKLCDIYGKLNEDYFGPDMVIDDEIRYEWARIPHFYRPFYVYKYATSYCASVALSEGIRKEAAGEASGNIKKYIEFLSMGSSLDPVDELRHAGVDFNTPEPVDRALEKFARVLDEAEKCAELIG